jgi:GST-like protein
VTYTPPRVWTWGHGERRAVRQDQPPDRGIPPTRKELPVGQHPLQLYSLATPNGVKVTVLLEELLAIGQGRRVRRVPREHRERRSVRQRLCGRESQFEDPGAARSQHGAADARVRVGRDPALPRGEVRRVRSDDSEPSARAPSASHGSFWQMGAAPFLGGGFGHFYAYAPEKYEYPINRYTMEVKRQLDVLDRNLADRRYLIGTNTRSPHMAKLALVRRARARNLYSAAEFLEVKSYKNVVRWAEEIRERPGVRRGERVNKAWGTRRAARARATLGARFQRGVTWRSRSTTSASAPTCRRSAG